MDSERAQDKPESSPENPTPRFPPAPNRDPKALIANLAEFTGLGEEHDLLRRFSGRWSYQADFDMMCGGPCYSASGFIVGRMILEGRHLHMEFRTKWSFSDYHGSFIMSYDPIRALFFCSFFENFHNAPTTLSGSWDDEREELVLSGTFSNAMFRMCHPLRQTWRFLDPHRIEFTAEIRREKDRWDQILYSMMNYLEPIPDLEG